MKLRTLLLITLFAISMNAFAQRVAWTRFKFGLQASPTVSWLKTDNPKIGNNGFNTGLKLGATADYYFLENYALSTGIGFGFNHGGKLYHEQGGKFLANSTLTDDKYNSGDKPLPDQVNIRYHIQYLEIPFALKMRTQPFGYFRIFAHAPIITLGWRNQARADITAEDLNLKKENIKKDVNPLLLSWGLGGGTEYELNPSTSLVAGLYYQRVFTDVTRDRKNFTVTNDNPYTTKSENSKAVLNAITLRLGVIF